MMAEVLPDSFLLAQGTAVVLVVVEDKQSHSSVAAGKRLAVVKEEGTAAVVVLGTEQTSSRNIALVYKYQMTLVNCIFFYVFACFFAEFIKTQRLYIRIPSRARTS